MTQSFSVSCRVCICGESASNTTWFTRIRSVEGKPAYEIGPLLRVNYHFHWQMSCRLAEPRFLRAGKELQAVAWYDNSEDNPHNPDADAAIRWGEHIYEEMMAGFFDVAVPASIDKQHFIVRTKN
jgi:hypothetical protein